MDESKWEKFKMKRVYSFFSIDEVFMSVLGLGIFIFQLFYFLRLYFVGLIILWYWFKIRNIESKIHKIKQNIYNVYYDECKPVPMNILEGRVEAARKPLNYELDQLECERKFLVDKFIIVNLILLILIQVFIQKQ